MSKTPEEMAEEYTKDWWGNLPEAEGMRKSARENFLAGYKAAMNENKPKVQELEANWKFCCEDKARVLNELAAAERAKEQVAEADNVMCSTTMEEIKAVDTGELMPITNLPTPAKWISVKDRLPEEGQRVLLYNSLEYVSIVMAHWYSSSQRPFFDHVTIDDIHMTFALEDNKHLYWMPLPAPPKEEK